MMAVARLHVVVRPHSKRTGLRMAPDGSWCIRIAAPPVEGKANRELVGYLARLLDRPPSSIRVTTGISGRHKTLEVKGMTLDQVTATLCAALDGERH
jgi:uncharacterized protein (TIGR00251 family)